MSRIKLQVDLDFCPGDWLERQWGMNGVAFPSGTNYYVIFGKLFILSFFAYKIRVVAQMTYDS